MRPSAVAIVLAAGLVAAPAAGAKGLSPARACGETGCASIEDDSDLMVVFYAHNARPQPPTLPYYRLDYRNAGAPSHYFVPARNLVGQMHAGGRWFSLHGPPLDAIRAAITSLPPFPAQESWAVRSPERAETTSHTLVAALLLIALAVGAVLAQRYGPDHRWQGIGAD
jgi:hypothetical protein